MADSGAISHDLLLRLARAQTLAFAGGILALVCGVAAIFAWSYDATPWDCEDCATPPRAWYAAQEAADHRNGSVAAGISLAGACLCVAGLAKARKLNCAILSGGQLRAAPAHGGLSDGACRHGGAAGGQIGLRAGPVADAARAAQAEPIQYESGGLGERSKRTAINAKIARREYVLSKAQANAMMAAGALATVALMGVFPVAFLCIWCDIGEGEVYGGAWVWSLALGLTGAVFWLGWKSWSVAAKALRSIPYVPPVDAQMSFRAVDDELLRGAVRPDVNLEELLRPTHIADAGAADLLRASDENNARL